MKPSPSIYLIFQRILHQLLRTCESSTIYLSDISIYTSPTATYIYAITTCILPSSYPTTQSYRQTENINLQTSFFTRIHFYKNTPLHIYKQKPKLLLSSVTNFLLFSSINNLKNNKYSFKILTFYLEH